MLLGGVVAETVSGCDCQLSENKSVSSEIILIPPPPGWRSCWRNTNSGCQRYLAPLELLTSSSRPKNIAKKIPSQASSPPLDVIYPSLLSFLVFFFPCLFAFEMLEFQSYKFFWEWVNMLNVSGRSHGAAEEVMRQRSDDKLKGGGKSKRQGERWESEGAPGGWA